MRQYTVFHNACVVTMNPELPAATAFAAAQKGFAGVDNDATVFGFAGDEAAHVIDLKGKTVVLCFQEPTESSYFSMEGNFGPG